MVHPEGLHDVVVGPRVQSLHDASVVVPRRRRPRPGRPRPRGTWRAAGGRRCPAARGRGARRPGDRPTMGSSTGSPVPKSPRRDPLGRPLTRARRISGSSSTTTTLTRSARSSSCPGRRCSGEGSRAGGGHVVSVLTVVGGRGRHLAGHPRRRAGRPGASAGPSARAPRAARRPAVPQRGDRPSRPPRCAAVASPVETPTRRPGRPRTRPRRRLPTSLGSRPRPRDRAPTGGRSTAADAAQRRAPSTPTRPPTRVRDLARRSGTVTVECRSPVRAAGRHPGRRVPGRGGGGATTRCRSSSSARTPRRTRCRSGALFRGRSSLRGRGRAPDGIDDGR